MERVPMDIDQVLSQLSGEIQAGEKDGSIEVLFTKEEYKERFSDPGSKAAAYIRSISARRL